MFISTKAFSQDSLKTKSYAIVEITTIGKAFGSESIKIYYDNGKVEDLTGKLYKNSGNNLPDISLDNDDKNYHDTPPAQKALLCIKYMTAKNYVLISSTAIAPDRAVLKNSYSYYTYQYIFEKRDK